MHFHHSGPPTDFIVAVSVLQTHGTAACKCDGNAAPVHCLQMSDWVCCLEANSLLLRLCCGQVLLRKTIHQSVSPAG